MERLLELQLVSKVCKELENHIGSGEKALAEFVIYLAREESKDSDDFYNKLLDNDAELPRDFVENLYNMIRRMSSKPPPISSSSSSEKPSSSSNISDKFNSAGKFSVGTVSGDVVKVSQSGPIDDDFKKLHALDSVIKEEFEYNEKKKKEHLKKFSSLSIPDKVDNSSHKESFQRKDNFKQSSSSASSSSSSRQGNYKKSNRQPVDIKENEIYGARVTSIKSYGFFARLEESIDGNPVLGSKDGLCHISEISNDKKVNSVEDFVKRNDRVWVKVIVNTDARISLSMREVDQLTGKDLFPRNFVHTKNSSIGSSSLNDGDDEEEEISHSGIPLEKLLDDERKRPLKKLNPFQLWEQKQLAASGLISNSEVYGDDEGNVNYEDIEEDLEVEMNEKEPAFLKGQTEKGGITYSPLRLARIPDGSLLSAAKKQLEISQERREIREEQKAKALGSFGDDAPFSEDDPLFDYYRRVNESTDFSSMKGLSAPDWRKSAISGMNIGSRSTSATIKEQRESLPAYKFRKDLLQSIRDNQVLIVIGETGSGKTTQLTQFLAEEGLNGTGMIACTQPRRVAAISVARRVAEEFGCRVGQEVGYTVRFEDCTSQDTVIKYMTDGMLLREALLDTSLEKYSIIMLDEAHERSLHTDVLFGLLKKLVKKRKDLRLIVTSATMDAVKFSSYFYGCPIFTIEGRMYPVDIFYTKEPEEDYLDACLITVMQIHLTEPPGDILVFLTGQEEIDTACQMLFERMKALGDDIPELVILPIYAALPPEMQTKIFEPAPAGGRKVVIATNIAETSITIDGIYYVVDPGFVKQNIYNPKTGMDQLTVVPISQASANQRAGRAGRTGPGKCYRLYTEDAYKNEMLPSTVPEIQRTNLANVVLTLKAMGINDLLNFDFMDPPPPQTLITAMEQLFTLGALDEDGLLTKLGRKMAEFPLEPQMAKTLIAAVDLKCSDEVLTIVSMLSVQGIFYRPRDKQQQADQKKARFFQPEGDHLTLLAVYQSWERNNYSVPWCFENFIQARSMKRAQDVRKQLLTIMDRYKLRILSCGKNYTRIRKAITSGFFAHASKKDPQEGYKTLVENQPVYIHPGSALFHRNPEWVIYHSLILTSKEYMREVITIEPKWLVELAPNFYKVHDPTKLSKRKRQEKIEPLFNKYGDDPLKLLKKRK
ncbi:hypothetical protein ABK040_009875 [Willaertia magna]